MIASRKPITKIKTDFNSYQEISYELAFGMRYGKTSIGSFLNILIHPTRIQDRIDKEAIIGDCNDHAIYWVTTLLKTEFAKNVWFSFFMFEDCQGILKNHTVCVFENWNNELFWVDYNKPHKFSKLINLKQWDWCEQVADAFSSGNDTLKPISAGMFKIDKLNKRDRPVFGEITNKVW